MLFPADNEPRDGCGVTDVGYTEAGLMTEEVQVTPILDGNGLDRKQSDHGPRANDPLLADTTIVLRETVVEHRGRRFAHTR